MTSESHESKGVIPEDYSVHDINLEVERGVIFREVFTSGIVGAPCNNTFSEDLYG